MRWKDARGVGIAGGTTTEGYHLLFLDLDLPKTADAPHKLLHRPPMRPDDPQAALRERLEWVKGLARAGDRAAAVWLEVWTRLANKGGKFRITASPSGGLHMGFRTDTPVTTVRNLLGVRTKGQCAIDVIGAGLGVVTAGLFGFGSTDDKPVQSMAKAQSEGWTGSYRILWGGSLAVADLAVVTVEELSALGLCGQDGGRPSPLPANGAMPAEATERPAGGQVGASGGSLLPGGKVSPAGAAQTLPAHIAGALDGGSSVRSMVTAQRSDPAEVQDAMLHVIAADEAAGKDTGDRDYWLNTVKLPLAGDIATGRLTEDETRPVFVAASEACGGAVDTETDWQKFIASDVPNAQALAQAGKRPKTTASVFKDAQAAGWVPVTPQGADGAEVGHGGARQAAGRKPGASVPELINLLAGLPIKFGFNERTGKHTFDLLSSIKGVALAVGNQQQVDDMAARQIAALLSHMTGRDITPAKAFDVMHTAGDANKYDPAREMLFALVQNVPWDGTPRLDTWLSTYLGVTDTPLHRAWGRLTVLALIARILKPGCKWDHVLTLVGPQGAGKSSVARVMAFERPDGAGDAGLFTDSPVLGLEPREFMEATGGKLIVEMGDMARGRAREVEHDKALITRTHDEARMAYGRATTRRPRGFIFIASTNDNQFLSDVTGNRRWWPVNVGAFDPWTLHRDWPQIVVEAVQVFFGPEFDGDVTRVKLDPALYAAATAAQAAFTVPDEVRADIETMLRQKGADGSWGVKRVEVRGSLRVRHDDLRNRLASGAHSKSSPAKLGKDINRVLGALGWTLTKNQGDRQWVQPASWGDTNDSRDKGRIG